MSKTAIPTRSSGALWSPEDDARLHAAVLDLTAEFPGRSVAAVVTRIALLSPQWSRTSTPSRLKGRS